MCLLSALSRHHVNKDRKGGVLRVGTFGGNGFDEEGFKAHKEHHNEGMLLVGVLHKDQYEALTEEEKDILIRHLWELYINEYPGCAEGVIKVMKEPDGDKIYFFAECEEWNEDEEDES